MRSNMGWRRSDAFQSCGYVMVYCQGQKCPQCKFTRRRAQAGYGADFAEKSGRIIAIRDRVNDGGCGNFTKLRRIFKANCHDSRMPDYTFHLQTFLSRTQA